MSAPRVAFIGLGEAGSIFAKALRKNGADVSAFDTNHDRAGVPLEEALRGASHVLSTVWPRSAEEAAAACAAHLAPGQVFVDLNSTTPEAKARIAEIVGAGFVEGAILGAVGASGASTRILTAGPGGEAAAEFLRGLGLNVSFCGPRAGTASRFKMMRSIFSKGLEALLLELQIAGARAGIREELWKDVVGFMTENPFDRVASNWIRTHPAAHERRHHEMVQVVEALRKMGMDPVMTSATADFFGRSRSLGLKRAFPEAPATAEPVVDFMEKHL